MVKLILTRIGLPAISRRAEARHHFPASTNADDSDQELEQRSNSAHRFCGQICASCSGDIVF